MDTEQTDAVDIGVDEHISETFNGQVSFADPVGQENTLENGKLQEKESKDGDCHIFNYQDFHTLPPRIGSEKDAERLEHDFTQLNLEVHCHQNLLYKETFRILNEASKKDYFKCKYFICCFLTHGKQHFLWAKDRSMEFDDILKIFSESSSLKGIPKIFIIQACQGGTPEEGVSADSTDGGFSTDTQDYLDFLIVNSTYFDTVSFRYTYKKEEKCHGSFFVDEFCRSLEEFSSKLDLLQILTIVNYRMSHFFLSHHKDKMEIDQKKQMPCFTSTLRKKIEFKREIEEFISTDTMVFENRRKQHWFGSDSTDFLLKSNFYNIEKAKRVLYLHVANEQMIDKEDLDVQRAFNLDLWGTFGNRNYSRKKFQGKFQKAEILKFLEQSSNKPLERIESKAKKSSEIDCLICYIAANSKNDCICDAENRTILKKEIVAEIISQLNKSFVGKPKIFIFLLRKLSESEGTFRSKRFYEGNSEEDTESETESNDAGFQNSTDGGIDQNMNSTGRFNAEIESTDGGCVGKNLIPVHADILEISITVSDWKHIVKPLDLFQKILAKSASTDLISLLTEFNCELVEKCNFFYVPKEISKSVSSFTVSSTLTKDLYLKFCH